MPDAASPGSSASHDDHNDGTEDGNSKHHAAKDRECQFCHQKFTSSSLGRHLDQFLNKKKPDGIHDVEDIRRLRGGITRRTARQNGKNEYDESRTSNASPAPTQQSPTGPMVDTLNTAPVNGLGTKLNSMNWHTTGVINNLKDISTTIASPISTPISAKRNFSTFAGIEQPTTRPSGTDNEKDTTIRALELSLREVLDSVHAATARAAPRPSPFTFDLQTQTFPSLVLQLLPTPPTLFSATPFATSTSAPLSPPNASHLALLRLHLETKIQTWKWDSLRHAQSQTFPTAHAQNLGEEADQLGHQASQYELFARKHLDGAFHAWTALSPPEQHETWSLELMRAFASKSRKVQDLEDHLDALTSEANRLAGQVEHLSRCQWPREMALWPPERVKFSKVARDEIRGINLDVEEGADGGRYGGRDAMDTKDIEQRWEYEQLVGKWKRRVREDRTRRSGIANTGVPAGPGTGTRVNELAREEGSATPPLQLLNGTVNSGAGNEQRRKSARQSQSQQPPKQHLITSTADQDERVREFSKGLEHERLAAEKDRESPHKQKWFLS